MKKILEVAKTKYKLPKKSPNYWDNKKGKKTCLLMYSGGVDTSLCVHLLKKY